MDCHESMFCTLRTNIAVTAIPFALRGPTTLSNRRSEWAGFFGSRSFRTMSCLLEVVSPGLRVVLPGV